jgi:hypothetical protein
VLQSFRIDWIIPDAKRQRKRGTLRAGNSKAFIVFEPQASR